MSETKHTYIGSTENFNRRLQEHNATTVWVPLMVVQTDSVVQAKEIEQEWQKIEHCVEKRIKFGFQIVRKHSLTVYVSDIKIGLLSLMPEGEFKKMDKEFWKMTE